MKKARIMCTLTPERESEPMLSLLHQSGMDGLRINSAFATPESIRLTVQKIRKISHGISILMDTKGPEVRTTDVEVPVTFSVGAKTTLKCGDKPSTAKEIFVNLPFLPQSLGGKAVFDDGEIEFNITSCNGNRAVMECTKDGTLHSRKTFQCPGAELPYMPAVSERDKTNIAAAKESGIDMLAHSFVRNAADVHAVRELLNGTDIKLFAKIECREALENLPEIIEAADGLLVARGDLSTAIGIVELPFAQRHCADLCHKSGKPLILATGILGSMIHNPEPTRAEVNDVLLALDQRFGWLLLTGETARGVYPVQCVQTLHQLINHA